MLLVVAKSNRLLKIFLAAFLLIAFRIWHLAVIQRDEKIREAYRPQHRTIIEPAQRGAILDRFGIPLAMNRIGYSAAIYYNQIATIPSIVWQTNENGERVKVWARKNYIHKLAKTIAHELDLEAERVEDLIHAKATLLPHVPFLIQTSLSESQYYRLKALERTFPGLRAEIRPERIYPQGMAAASLIGQMGSINQKEYLSIVSEIQNLQQQLSEGNDDPKIEEAFHALKEKAYTINDFVGKSGLEKQYEKELRGTFGKKIFEIDQKGRPVKETSGGHEPVAGKTINLSLSCELQQFCETLLIQNETARSKGVGKQPFIKGGAIVAMDPNSGEIVAMASLPRFDPNDFIPTSSHRSEKNQRITRWLENERYLANLWDGKERLFRETGERTCPMLSWDLYLQFVLPADGPLTMACHQIDTVQKAILLQEDFEALLYLANCPSPSLLMDLLFPSDTAIEKERDIETAKNALFHHIHSAMPHWKRLENFLGAISHNSDKLFVIDLCRLAVYSPAFTDKLILETGSTTISHYRDAVHSFQRLEESLRQHAEKIFHKTRFAEWRSNHQKEFIEEKRREEKNNKTYARPYIDYLDQKERQLFQEEWKTIRLPLIASFLRPESAPKADEWAVYLREFHPDSHEKDQLIAASSKVSDEELIQWLKTMRSFRELDRSLYGNYRYLRQFGHDQTERELASAFYPIHGFGFCKSAAYQSSAPLGSIFKLVTAYEALRQNGPKIASFELMDEITLDHQDHSLIVARSPDHKLYHRNYKGGRLPRSHLPHLGLVDLIGAIEQSSNPYFAILAGDFLENPQDLAQAALCFGLGRATGIQLPDERVGRLPDDLTRNRTGLYSFAIGQHTLETTPLQVAVMMSTLVTGGIQVSPTLLRSSSPHVASIVPLSQTTKNLLLSGMDRVVWGERGSARPSVIRALHHEPQITKDFLSLQHQMIGKTSTAEINCRLDCHPTASSFIAKHIWFGATAFPEIQSKRWENPELVVIVFLRYGEGGKEAAPIAARVIHKWREIQKNHLSKVASLEQESSASK